jgi:hypothetical protein
MFVIVAGELGHRLAEMPFAEDQHMIQALPAKRAHEPLGRCVRTRRPDRRLDDSHGIPGEDIVEGRGELAVPVADQEPEPAGAVVEIDQQVAGLLGGPGPDRVRGDAEDVHGPGLELQREQHIQALQQHSIDVQEVTGQYAGCLSGQELPPGRRRPPRRGPSLAAARIRRIVPSPTRYPRPSSSPWMRRYPQRGFCRASCSTRARTSAGIGGRPGVPG